MSNQPLSISSQGGDRSLSSLLIPIGVIGALLALIPLWLGSSRVMMGVAVLGLAFACYVIAFNIIFGSTGQLFLCVGALAGIGGYGGAILADNYGVPMVLSILLATLMSTVIGGSLSYVAVRRSLGVIFTGIVTLIFAMSFETLAARPGGTDRWGQRPAGHNRARHLFARSDPPLLRHADHGSRLFAHSRLAAALLYRLGL